MWCLRAVFCCEHTRGVVRSPTVRPSGFVGLCLSRFRLGCVYVLRNGWARGAAFAHPLVCLSVVRKLHMPGLSVLHVTSPACALRIFVHTASAWCVTSGAVTGLFGFSLHVVRRVLV